MTFTMDHEVKRWTARRKSTLVLEIIQHKTAVSEDTRQYDVAPSEIEEWTGRCKAVMESVLRAKPEDILEQYEREINTHHEVYGEAIQELLSRK